MEMSIPDAFMARNSLGSRAEIEEYTYWKWERERESKEENQPKGSDGRALPRGANDVKIMSAETDKRYMAFAMSSADNYLGFMQKRGYGHMNERVTNTIRV